MNDLLPVLADTYVLAVKTHAAHWNVTGTNFFQLHGAFASQYEALFEAADDLAERLRALGIIAPLGIRELVAHSTIQDHLGPTAGTTLVATLRDDHRRLASTATKALKAAQAAGDEVTADLLIGRIEDHEKMAWMLDAVGR